MKKSKQRPSVGAMNKFIKTHGGCFQSGVSPYQQAGEALEKLGHERGAISYKNFCIKHWAVILDSNKKTPPMRRAVSVNKMPKTTADVTTDAFLSSYEWRRVRLVALKKYGAKCQCCGATPDSGAVMNVDHIKPRRIYPELALDPDNLQVLCHECNHGKGNWDMTDWRKKETA